MNNPAPVSEAFKRFHLFGYASGGDDLLGSFYTIDEVEQALVDSDGYTYATLYEASRHDGTLYATRSYSFVDDYDQPPPVYGIPLKDDGQADMDYWHKLNRWASDKCHWQYYLIAESPNAANIRVKAQRGVK